MPNLAMDGTIDVGDFVAENIKNIYGGYKADLNFILLMITPPIYTLDKPNIILRP